MIAHQSPISGVACFQDKWIATAGYDNQVILWDAANRTAVSRVLHDHLANQCSFSPDGSHLVSASSDYTARLWSVPEMRLCAVLADHDDDVEMAVFHPSLPLIATASRDHSVRVFNFDGSVVAELKGHTADVISVEWAEKPDELVSSSDDGTIRRWSVQKSVEISSIDMGGVETDTVALDADGTVYAGNDDGEIVIVRDGVRTTIPAHRAGIKRLVLSAEHGLLVSLSYDRTARIWQTETGTLVPLVTTDLPSDVWPRSCAVTAAGTIVFATFGSTYRTFDPSGGIWDATAIPPTWGANAVAVLSEENNTAPASSGEIASSARPSALVVGDAGRVWSEDLDSGGRSPVSDVGSLCNFLTPASGTVFTGGQLGIVADALTGRVLHQHHSPLNCGGRFRTHDSELVVIGTYTGEGLVFRREGTANDPEWNFDREIRLFDNAVKSVAIGESLLFAVCADTSAVWIDLLTFQPVRRVGEAHERIANGCASLGGDTFGSISRDLNLRIWAPDQDPEVVRTPHDHSIKCIASDSRSGGLVATGSYNGRIAVLDLATRRWVSDVRPTTSGISSLAYDRARDCFIASSYDGKLYQVDAH